MLQRLRAQPGQKLLAGFQAASGSGSFSKDSLYPQAKVRSDDPGRAADLASQPPAAEAELPPDNAEPPAMPEPHAGPQAAAPAPVAEADAQLGDAKHAPEPGQPATASHDIGGPPTAGQPQSAHQAPTLQACNNDASAAAPPAEQSHDGFELSLQLPPDPEERATVPPPQPAPSALAMAAVTCAPSVQQHSICPPTQAEKRLAQVEEAPPVPVADDTPLAQQVRAQAYVSMLPMLSLPPLGIAWLH